MLHDLDRDDRPATSQEQAVLARWAGWGSLPQVFDLLNDEWLGVGDELRDLLSDADYQAARASTLNAHYTSVDVANAMWQLAADLGFAHGRVLEPGCGAGTFLGLAPAGAQLVGVEVEPTTGRIARALHPHAEVRVEGFETTRLSAGSFDLAIGNVPFGDYPLHDPVHNPGNRHSVHNHFLIKALDLVRPGGLAVLLTSRYTLDAADPTARRALAAAGDLLGAVRLPSNAFAASAGTAVVTDLLVLRRRHDHEPALPLAWEHAAPLEVDGGRVTVNEWYAHHPELMLGTPQSRHGMYGPGDLVVKPDARPLADALADAAARVARRARDTGRTLTPALATGGVGRGGGQRSGEAAALPSGAALNEGAFLVDRSGQVRRVLGGLAEPCTVRPARDLAELRALVGLRDAAKQLLAVQADDPVDDSEVAAGQQRLHRLYDAYTTRYGPLNRFTLIERGTDPETGEPVTRRRYPTMGGFRTDPDYHLVLALEVFDPDSQTAAKAPIFDRRVIAARTHPSTAATATDALAVCLDETGRVDLDRIAALLGFDAGDAAAALGELAYPDPASGLWDTAERYLSGNVRAKLAAARAAADDDPAWERNVAALEAVHPRELTAGEIDGRLVVVGRRSNVSVCSSLHHGPRRSAPLMASSVLAMCGYTSADRTAGL